jgi:PKD repeat protein
MKTILLVGCLGSANRPPVARFDATPREGYAPLSVRLDASGTYDPDGDRVTYEWAFGDGETAKGRSVVHRFAEGDHTVTLLVTDAHGEIDEASATITARSVPDGFVVRHYEWTHDGEARKWDALLPYNLYQMYRGRLRTPLVDNYDYPAYVLDPLDDPTLEELADVLWNLTGGERDAFVEMALSFVQGAIGYEPDPPGKEWPLYPIETLVDAAGDCEDTAILLVSLLRAKDIGSALAAVDTDDDSTPDHVLVLVPVSAAYAAGLRCTGGGSLTILTLDGTLHAVAETAVESAPLGLGCDPWGLDAADVIKTWAFD